MPEGRLAEIHLSSLKIMGNLSINNMVRTSRINAEQPCLVNGDVSANVLWVILTIANDPFWQLVCWKKFSIWAGGPQDC